MMNTKATLSKLRPLRRIKVLGYPFAGGQPKSGVQLTPSWLSNQAWFKNMAGKSNGMIEYEEIKVSDQNSNTVSQNKAGAWRTGNKIKNFQNVMKSSYQLKRQTYKALNDGYYPIVLGGDHSQAIGSISGLKQFAPDAKILWVDAHIDINTSETSPSQNAHGMPVAFLEGLIPHQSQWKCLDVSKDICYFGIRSYEPEEIQLVYDKQIRFYGSEVCEPELIDVIERNVDQHFKQRSNKLWISFDIDGVDASEFLSTGTAEGNGLSIAFMESFFSTFSKRSIGMDFTEVNFELAPSDQMRQTDMETFRHLFELICHEVNQAPEDPHNLIPTAWEELMNDKRLPMC